MLKEFSARLHKRESNGAWTYVVMDVSAQFFVARVDQRRLDRAVQQVGAAALAGLVRRAGHVEDVIEELEGQSDPVPEGSEAVGCGRARVAQERLEAAGRLEQRARLQRAAL